MEEEKNEHEISGDKLNNVSGGKIDIKVETTLEDNIFSKSKNKDTKIWYKAVSDLRGTDIGNWTLDKSEAERNAEEVGQSTNIGKVTFITNTE